MKILCKIGLHRWHLAYRNTTFRQCSWACTCGKIKVVEDVEK